MSKRNITRRQVILGTAIAGVAGSSAIIHVLRSKYETDLPETEWEEVTLPPGTAVGKNANYGNEWKRDLRLINIPTKKISGPPTFQLNYQPEVESDYRLVLLNAAYSKQISFAKFPEVPSFYTFVEGTIIAVPPIVDDKPSLSIEKAKIASQSAMVKSGGESHGGCVAVKQNGNFDYYQVAQGRPQKVTKVEVGPACSVLGHQLAFDYPQGRSLSLGETWTLSTTALETGLEASDEIDLTCEVVGFADVAGRQTVKMLAKKHLTSRAYADVVAASEGGGPQQVTIRSSLAEGQGQTTAKVERLVSGKEKSTRAEQILQEGISKEIDIVCYVDLKTGVPVRRKLVQVLHNSKHPDRDMTTWTLSQVLEG